MEFLSTLKDGTVVLSLYVQPRASRTCFRGLHDGALKLAITAPPVDGKANKAVVGFLASFFKLPKQKITIISGLQSRRKRCVVGELSMKEMCRRLEGRIGG